MYYERLIPLLLSYYRTKNQHLVQRSVYNYQDSESFGKWQEVLVMRGIFEYFSQHGRTFIKHSKYDYLSDKPFILPEDQDYKL